MWRSSVEEEERGPRPKIRELAQAKRTLLFVALLLIAIDAVGNLELFTGKGLPHPLLTALSAPIIAFCITLSLLERQLIRFIAWTIGPVGHIEVSSPELEQRLRNRYKSEFRQLEFLGFGLLCIEGETFSMLRFPLVFPALFALVLRSRREVTAIHNHTSFLSAHAIFTSEDRTTYAHPNGLGIKFQTAFRDGTILLTKNYADEAGYAPLVIVQTVTGGASISDTWAAHLERIAGLQAKRKPLENLISFDSYVEISRRAAAL